MSVDDKLREAFGEETWDVDPGTALRQVHARAHRARMWKGTALAGVAAAGVLVTYGAVHAGGADQGAPAPSNPGVTQSPTGVERPTGPTPLDGTWELGPVTAAQIRTTLRQAGQGRWYRTVMRDQPRPPLTYRMTIGEGRVDVMVTGANGAHAPADQEYITLKGHEAVLEPLGVLGVNRYGWALVDGRLRLTFRSTSEGHEDITPSAAFQRATYTVADWTRVRPTG